VSWTTDTPRFRDDRTRPSADLQPHAEFFFAQALARAQLAMQDGIPQALRDILAQALAARRGQRRRHLPDALR
jgi:hypothetical protein